MEGSTKMYRHNQTRFPDLPHEGYRQAKEAWASAVATHAETRKEVDRLQGTRRNGTWPDGEPRFADGELADAIKADDVAQATAVRQGAKDPGRKNTQRVAKALRSAQDRERVQAEVVEQTYRAIFEVVQKHREDVLAAVDATKEERRRDYRDAVTALEAARRDFWRMDDMRRWVNDMSRLHKEPERPLVARNLRLPNGTPPMFDVITQGMRDETDPPEPERTPSHYRTVTEAITSPGGTHIGNTYRTEAVYDDTTTEETRQPSPGVNIGGVPVYTGDDG